MLVEIVFIFVVCSTLLVLYCQIKKHKHIQTCAKFFAQYPLYGRRIICVYNERNKHRYAKTGCKIIEDINIQVDEKLIKDELCLDLISEYSNIILDKQKLDELEERLKILIETFQKYPRAISIKLGCSYLGIHQSSVNTLNVLEKIFNLSNIDLLYFKIDDLKL